MDSLINIPFSVYTATHGYAWSNGLLDVTSEELDYLYRLLGQYRPDYMGGDDAFEGVCCSYGLVVPFKMQNIPKWDAYGRNADYCAFGFMGLDVVRRFDFDALLKQDEFVVPRHDPPDCIDYDGPTSVAHDVALERVLYERGSCQQIDFRSIGDLLFVCGELCDEWFFLRTRLRGQETTEIKTGAWKAMPASMKASGSRGKTTFTKLNAAEIEQMLKGLG